jgi:UDP-N-acetylmuramoyl-tripeptide--D-alanyl-D-alanine ligase
MLGGLYALFGPRFANTVVYMLQSTEYQVGPYLRWFWRTQNFAHVMKRRQLDRTKAARWLSRAIAFGMAIQIVIGVRFILLGALGDMTGGVYFGLALLISYPVVWAHLAVIPLELGRIFVIRPKVARSIKHSEQLFRDHPGVKIAVAGSYGKTSMKELLLTVLSEGLSVAATPANKNVASSHAVFAGKLKGDEEVLIIEYGEAAPGDIVRFAKTTHPTHGIITGLAPAHLDHYKTLEAAGKDIFSLAEYLKGENVYANGDSLPMLPFIQHTPGVRVYDANGALGWRVKDLELSPTATSFKLAKGKQTLQLTSGLLGRHQVGPLSIAAVLALGLGLTQKQVEAGVAKTEPFEHRMQPRQLGGAWIIDDTYNGNLEGVRAGTELLASLSAKRKFYVTPGLVDQGEEKERVHVEMGELIAKAKPDVVVLMKNSVTAYIEEGLIKGGYNGEIQIEDEPLGFYKNLEHFVAAGDVVLMQNDWTDNYA